MVLEPFMAMKGEIVVVSPDAGGVERARSFAKRIEAPLAIIDKRRDRPNQATATHVIGDVDGKIAVLVDDIIDTAGTICAGAEVLLREGVVNDLDQLPAQLMRLALDKGQLTEYANNAWAAGCKNHRRDAVQRLLIDTFSELLERNATGDGE